MNKTRPEAKKLIEELKPVAENATCGVVICVPFTNLETAVDLTKGTNIKVGAENCHFEKSGAFVITSYSIHYTKLYENFYNS